MTHPSVFKTAEDETAYRAVYDDTLASWPVPFAEIDVPSRFGSTHIVVSGPEDGPPLVLLHGFNSTLAMWMPNIADFAADHRVYAIDTMGQPSKSIPAEPIAKTADFAEWLSATADGLNLGRFDLLGMSTGAWIALIFAMSEPQRVRKLVLLSPAASFLPLVRQFGLRIVLMMMPPKDYWFRSLMGWMGIKATPGEPFMQSLLDLMLAGGRYFQMPPETLRVLPDVFSDEELRGLEMPVLLLIGEDEVIYDAAKAVERARRLVPDFAGELVPDSKHDMSITKHETVDARVLDFLSE